MFASDSLSTGPAASATAPVPHAAASTSRILGWTLFALALLLLWDASGLDLPLAHWFGTPAGFALRENAFLVKVMHVGGMRLSWAVLIALAVGVRWPFGVLRRISRAERVQLVVSVLVGVVVVSLIKTTSHTSCPWDLDAFGGVAHYVSHWHLGARDGGPGHCFPGGHASAAFAYLGGYFALRRAAPRAARLWLAAALVLGLAFGWSQQMRGAHYMSHTFWTAWICWASAVAVDAGARAVAARRRRHAAEQQA